MTKPFAKVDQKVLLTVTSPPEATLFLKINKKANSGIIYIITKIIKILHVS
jgi:hypothetical protein